MKDKLFASDEQNERWDQKKQIQNKPQKTKLYNAPEIYDQGSQ